MWSSLFLDGRPYIQLLCYYLLAVFQRHVAQALAVQSQNVEHEQLGLPHRLINLDEVLTDVVLLPAVDLLKVEILARLLGPVDVDDLAIEYEVLHVMPLDDTAGKRLLLHELHLQLLAQHPELVVLTLKVATEQIDLALAEVHLGPLAVVLDLGNDVDRPRLREHLVSFVKAPGSAAKHRLQWDVVPQLVAKCIAEDFGL